MDTVNYGAKDYGGVRTKPSDIDGLSSFEESVLEAVRFGAAAREDRGGGGINGDGDGDGDGARVTPSPPMELRERMWWGLTNIWEAGLMNELRTGARSRKRPPASEL